MSDAKPCCIDLSTVAVFSGTALVAYLIQKQKSCNSRSPPGPLALPLVGNLLQIAQCQGSLPKLFNRWANEYGPIYVVQLGRETVVVLNTMDVIIEAFVRKGHVFCDRPCWLPAIQSITEGHGLAWQNGEQWKELRQWAHRSLRDCGVGSRNLEERIQDEVDALVHEFAKRESTIFCPTDILNKASTNIVVSLVFGNRYDYTSRPLCKLVSLVRTIVSEFGALTSLSMIPGMSSLPTGSKSKCSSAAAALVTFIEDEIDRHKLDYDSGNLRDLIDLYLKERSNGRKTCLSRQNLVMIIMDLLCGAEPTSTVLSWAALCLVTYPEVQRRCQTEVDEVLGCGRVPDLEDMPRMPYVQATIQEVLRRFTALPLGVLHSTKHCTSLCGYDIAANTMVLCNQHAVHMNEKYWINPCQFRPERFLDDDCCKPKLQTYDTMIPFGIGPRVCMGEHFAQKIIFLALASLLQRFDFQRACDCDDYTPCFEGHYDGTFAPLPYEIKLRVH